MLLEIARECVSAPAPVGVELVFTTCEEIGLRGAHAFDVTSACEAEFGYASTTRPRSAS